MVFPQVCHDLKKKTFGVVEKFNYTGMGGTYVMLPDFPQ